MRKKLTVLLAALLALGLCGRTYAAQLPDPDRRGSIVFAMDFDGVPLEGGSLAMYRVGEIAERNGDYGFACVSGIENIPLDDLDDPALAAVLAEAAEQAGLEPVTAAITGGEARFGDVEPGLYVAVQHPGEETPGYAPIDPFLMSLPRWQDGVYAYDLTASPKVPLEPAPTEPDQPTEPTRPTEPNLPQTGQLNWPIPLMAVSGLALFMTGCILCFRRKRERYEK